MKEKRGHKEGCRHAFRVGWLQFVLLAAVVTGRRRRWKLEAEVEKGVGWLCVCVYVCV